MTLTPGGATDPKVVATVQEAIMKHPFWKPGLGSSGFAFGLANTAIEAYTSALQSIDRPSPDSKLEAYRKALEEIDSDKPDAPLTRLACRVIARKALAAGG